ncbi:MAG TPA: hypothetical protein VK071_04115 [Tissierellales bacterium]|nr:hypothetical protein [Tissierellales bacterium]
MKDMIKNPETIKELINQAKEIGENNSSSIDNLSSMEIILTSNDYATAKDPNLSKTFYRLQEKIEDANILTSQLLSNLENRDNDHESIH